MSFVIGLVLLAALGYVGYRFLSKKEDLDHAPSKTADAVVDAPVVAEPVIEAVPPAVGHVSETYSVEIQNTESSVEPAPKQSKKKAKAKTSAPKKTKKPKLEVAK